MNGRALDGENEKLVTNTIYHDVNKNRDKTIIMITHRRESIMKCDRLYVLNKGECIEEGIFIIYLIPQIRLFVRNARFLLDS